MKYFILACTFLIVQPSFRTDQKKNARVKTAYSEKYEGLKTGLEKIGIPIAQSNICVVVFKEEQSLQIWARNGSSGSFTLFKSYPICASSGDLGPKRQGGDGQVPEGFYHIDRFNPYSSFYLSLGVSYPNASDRILGYKKNLGGDIFIHGSCVTIGCMPLTDDLIKEVYVLAVEARSAGQGKIPCLIFPCVMDEKGMGHLKKKAGTNTSLYSFWENLQSGYLKFVKNKRPPSFTVKTDGSYQFADN